MATPLRLPSAPLDWALDAWPAARRRLQAATAPTTESAVTSLSMPAAALWTLVSAAVYAATFPPLSFDVVAWVAMVPWFVAIEYLAALSLADTAAAHAALLATGGIVVVVVHRFSPPF